MTTSSTPHSLDGISPQHSSTAGGVQPPLNGNDKLFGGDLPSAKAKDVSRRANIYERRHYDTRDIEAQHLRATEPHNWRPFPVIIDVDGYRLVDGGSLIEAICLIDSETVVPIEVISVAEGLRIRSQNNAGSSRPEPMARARRALILRGEGYTNAQIARELRFFEDDAILTDARVNQLRGAAEAEKKFQRLSEIIASPAHTPVRFYEVLKATCDAREKLDVESPVSNGPSRVARFANDVATLVKAGNPMEYHEIEERLKLVGRREFKRRARHIGEETLVPGSREVMWLEPERTGGPVANLPQSFTPAETEIVFGAVLNAVAEVLAARTKPGAN